MFVTLNLIVEAFNELKDIRPGFPPYFVNPFLIFFAFQVTEAWKNVHTNWHNFISSNTLRSL